MALAPRVLVGTTDAEPSGSRLGAGLSAVPRDMLATPVAAVAEQIIHPGAPVYRTAVGERSTVTLPDGSVVTLNTDTVLRVAFSDQARGVRLVRGKCIYPTNVNGTGVQLIGGPLATHPIETH